MSLAPVVVIHLTAALAALLVGPLALWTRLAAPVRPRWHRALGYGWFTCMVAVVLSALFIRSRDLPNIAGYTPLHLLVPVTSFLLYRGLAAVMRGDIAAHRRTMQRVYIGACLVAGSFTLLPQRYLGQLLWGQWLGWL